MNARPCHGTMNRLPHGPRIPRRIVLLTGNHLCHNPRAAKEADALARAGFDVEILGASFLPGLRALDLQMARHAAFVFTSVIDFAGAGLPQMLARAAAAAGRAAHRSMHVENALQLGPVYWPLRRAALARTADLFIAHSEPAIAVAVALLARGRSVGVDMEDWFSEDLAPEARKARPVDLLRRLESTLLNGGSHATCPSQAMRDALVAAYRCPLPHVVYNAPAASATLKRRGHDRIDADDTVSVHWFSQTLGPGRGLEDLFAALPLVQAPFIVHLRGARSPAVEAWLKESVPSGWRERVHLHDLVPQDELPVRIAEHDIGFAGELPSIRSRDLTVTNKVLQYLAGGLAVVASDTEGQREVARQAPDAVRLYRSGNAESLARLLDAYAASPDRLRMSQQAALRAAAETFTWERQERVLLSSVDVALAA